MKKSNFTKEQIMAILREQEAGAKPAEVWRRHGISGAKFYAWKAKFGGMEPSEAKRLKALENGNAKLKQLLAEAMLDWTCTGFAPVRCSCWAALCSKATGLFQPRAECFRRGL